MEQKKTSFITRNGCIAAFIFSAVIGAVLYRAFTGYAENMRMQSCQYHLRELAEALQIYWSDYNGMLPSSALRQSKTNNKWDPKASAEFCGAVGKISPPLITKPEDVHWIHVLWPHMMNSGIIWCPSDPDRPSRRYDGVFRNEPKPDGLVTYIYKPALDRAWFDELLPVDPKVPEKGMKMKHFRKESDFELAADQMMFFEKKGWHWEDDNKGWRDGVTVNAVFLDGHVRNIKFTNTVDADCPENTTELTRLLEKGGEPLWYNYDSRRSKDTSYKGERGILFDPRIYYDQLP